MYRHLKYLLIIILCTLGCAPKYTGVLKEISSPSKKFKYFNKTVAALFDTIKTDHNYDLNMADEFFMIFGTDICSAENSGRIWNAEHVFHFSIEPSHTQNKDFDILVSKADSTNMTIDFTSVLHQIELGDTLKVIDFAKEHEVYSCMYHDVYVIKGGHLQYTYSLPPFADNTIYRNF